MISGVSDQGIGGATAERFAREGASLAIGYFGTTPQRLLRKLERWNVPHWSTACDVTSHAEVQSWVQGCVERLGRLDVVINNAGIEVASRFEKISDDDWQRLLDVNLTGAMRLTRAALPHLTAPGGVIAGIASTLALAPCAGFPGYGASKAGLIAMLQGLAVELAPRGIRALCVAPALVPTPMTAHHIARMDGKVDPAQMAGSHPLGLGSPHDVAAALAFLTSDDARWITGVTVPMGWLPNYLLPLEEFLPERQLPPGKPR
jgi:3-oxoacyl-[acyl-carrier protein] reductase